MITVVITLSILFRLDLILHACKILLRCDSFGILNFATKQGLDVVQKRKCMHERIFHCVSGLICAAWKKGSSSPFCFIYFGSLVEHVHDTSSSSRDDLRAFCIQHLFEIKHPTSWRPRSGPRPSRCKARHSGPTRMTTMDSKINQLVCILYQF